MLVPVYKSFVFKFDPENHKQMLLQYFAHLVQRAIQQLLERLWSEKWHNTLARSKQKAYKVIDESQVTFPLKRKNS